MNPGKGGKADQDALGWRGSTGRGSVARPSELSQRMLDAIAPVVDRIDGGKQLAEVPQAVVDDAVVPVEPTP
ncbi:hypothetical protein ACK8N7_33485 [Streptomyces griseobrunneus]